jgi:hypothetical protein
VVKVRMKGRKEKEGNEREEIGNAYYPATAYSLFVG